MQQRQQKRSSGRIAEGFQGIFFSPQNNILLLSSFKICGRERERERERERGGRVVCSKSSLKNT